MSTVSIFNRPRTCFNLSGSTICAPKGKKTNVSTRNLCGQTEKSKCFQVSHIIAVHLLNHYTGIQWVIFTFNVHQGNNHGVVDDHQSPVSVRSYWSLYTRLSFLMRTCICKSNIFRKCIAVRISLPFAGSNLEKVKVLANAFNPSREVPDSLPYHKAKHVVVGTELTRSKNTAYKRESTTYRTRREATSL